MKCGAMVANKGPLAYPDACVELARAADELGLESLWAADHIIMPVNFDPDYSLGHNANPSNFEMPIAESLIWLAYMGAITQNVHLGTGVSVIPQRHPVLMAKQLATLDVLTEGRISLGVGVGYMREELAVFGVGYRERGERTDDYLTVMQELWTSERPTHHSRFVDFENMAISPRPTRPTGIPMVVGSGSEPAARRAGRLGDGWWPYGADVGRMSIEELEHYWPIVRTAAETAGRDPDKIEITTWMPRTKDDMKRQADFGVARFVASPLAEYETDLPVHVRTAADIRIWIGAFQERVDAAVPVETVPV